MTQFASVLLRGHKLKMIEDNMSPYFSLQSDGFILVRLSKLPSMVVGGRDKEGGKTSLESGFMSRLIPIIWRDWKPGSR